MGFYKWKYNAAGNVAQYSDNVENKIYTYAYDLSGRLTEMNRNDGAYIHTAYDTKNLTTGLTYSFGGLTESMSFTYKESMDNAPENAVFTDTSQSAISYDSLGRKYRDYITSPSGTVLTSTYSYVDHATVANRTSGLVSKIDYSLSSLDDLEYTYDSRGNITSVTVGGITDRYTYDSLNRLVQTDSLNQGRTFVYEYDASGNIISKKEYAYKNTSGTPIDTIVYTYGSADWKDKLTKYDGKAIDYDEIGNPLTYDGKTFTWVGRRLNTYTSGATTTSYTYNADGIRTSKTVGSTKTEYFLNGSQILAQKTGSNVIPFYYDANGTRIAFKYNGTMYYYVYNLQGDVTHIIDANKNIVGTYQYDAWGKILNLGSLTAIAQANPFRYRGYYYDTESGLYYLNSRYYNAEWGRFINADGYVSTGQGVTGYNMFAYCNNNPVNNIDPSGCACICLTKRVNSSRHKCSDNESAKTYGDALSTIMDFSSMIVDVTYECVKDLYRNSSAPNNVGAGTYKKYITTQLATLTKESKYLSKIFNAISYICVGITASEEAYNNYSNGETLGKIIWDFTVELSISSACVYFSTTIGTIAGSFVGNPIVGALGGAAVGILLGALLDIVTDEPKKTMKGWVG